MRVNKIPHRWRRPNRNDAHSQINEQNTSLYKFVRLRIMMMKRVMGLLCDSKAKEQKVGERAFSPLRTESWFIRRLSI